MLEPKMGRPSGLTPEIHAKIIDAVPKVYVQNQIAAMARVPKQTLSDWLILGMRDKLAGTDSVYAHLSDDYLSARTKLIQELLTELRTCKTGYGALTWILERCFREDFGAESEEFKLVLAELLKLKEDYLQLKDELIKKGKRHG